MASSRQVKHSPDVAELPTSTTVYSLHDNVYRTALELMVSPDPSEVDKWLDMIGFTGERHEHASRNAMYYRIKPDENRDKENCTFIWLREKHIPSLAHELTHFIFGEFEEKGIPLSAENDEVFAYYMEFWLNMVLDEWEDAVDSPSELEAERTTDPASASQSEAIN